MGGSVIRLLVYFFAMIVGDFQSDIPAISVAKSHLALLRLGTVMIVGAIPSLIPAGIVSP